MPHSTEEDTAPETEATAEENEQNRIQAATSILKSLESLASCIDATFTDEKVADDELVSFSSIGDEDITPRQFRRNPALRTAIISAILPFTARDTVLLCQATSLAVGLCMQLESGQTLLAAGDEPDVELSSHSPLAWNRMLDFTDSQMTGLNAYGIALGNAVPSGCPVEFVTAHQAAVPSGQDEERNTIRVSQAYQPEFETSLRVIHEGLATLHALIPAQ